MNSFDRDAESLIGTPLPKEHLHHTRHSISTRFCTNHPCGLPTGPTGAHPHAHAACGRQSRTTSLVIFHLLCCSWTASFKNVCLGGPRTARACAGMCMLYLTTLRIGG